MSKMSIAQAAEHFGISKEAIHNRIRRGTLQSVVEGDVKMVIIDGSAPASKAKPARKRSSNAVSQDDRYYKFLEDQNAKLQNRVDTLEVETRTLREQKEQMLIDERIKIEEIYKQKDEQLKNIINAISSKFMLNAPEEESVEIVEEDDEDTGEEENHLEAEIEDLDYHLETYPTSLKKYLKKIGYPKKTREKIIKKFKKRAKKDDRMIVLNNKCYIDTIKYDYSDLL